MRSGPAAETIKIGSVLSITGPAAFLGDPEDKTLKLYVDKINAAGGVAGKKIELIVYDDGGDANKARTFATRLLEDDQVVAMVGGSTTGTTMAMIPVFEEAKVPFISLAGGIEVVDPVRKYVFKTPHTDRMACEKIFENLKLRTFTRIAMISGTDGFGASMRGQCLKVAANYGIQIVADETYGPRDTDMTAQLTKIKNTAGIQAVVNPGFVQGPAIVTRNYAQLGMSATPLTRAIASPRRVLLNSPDPRLMASGFRHRHFWSGTNCPTPIRRRRSSWTTSRPTRRRRNSRFRRSVVMPMTGFTSWSTR